MLDFNRIDIVIQGNEYVNVRSTTFYDHASQSYTGKCRYAHNKDKTF